ncbi:MAG: PcfB family protein [Bacilli bacterium]|nr:PcfB family protein [Bacilli bacterium]
MNSSEAAESIVKMSLEGIEVAARITGTGVERIAVALLAMAKQKQMTKGKTNLNNMLKSGKPLQIFSLKQEELKKFHDESKKYGILYTALIDKKHPDTDGLVDIMVRQQDAIRVNHIFDRFKLSAVNLADIRTEVEKDKMEEMLQDAKERGVEIKSNEEKLVDDIMSKPIQKEQQEMSNPQVAKTEKNPLSEPSSENKNKSGVASKEQRPSVRETLKEIKKELKEKEASKDEKQEVKEGKSLNVDKDKNMIKPSNKNKKGKER